MSIKTKRSMPLFATAALIATIVATISTASVSHADDVYLTDAEYELGNLINQYRLANGLVEIPVTISLTNVAQLHVLDLNVYEPDSHPDCNLHSWSDNGIWSPVCYTPDHANAAGMFNKPREITNNLYTGDGTEISIDGGGTSVTPEIALSSWQSSAGHDDLLLNQGVFAGYTWQAMGVGIYEDHANVWFGQVVDPQGLATVSVPEPSSAWLLVFGLITAGSLRIKRGRSL